MRGHAEGVAALGSPAFLSLHRPTGHAASRHHQRALPLAAKPLHKAAFCKAARSRPQSGLCAPRRLRALRVYKIGLMQSFAASGAAVVACTSSPVSHAHGLSCRAVVARPLGAPAFFYSQCGFAAWAYSPPTPPTLRASALRALASAGWPVHPAPQGAGFPPRLRFSLSLRVVGRRSVCHQGTATVRASERTGRAVSGGLACSASPWGPQPPYPQGKTIAP